jgi:hypothetical protein
LPIRIRAHGNAQSFIAVTQSTSVILSRLSSAAESEGGTGEVSK